MGEEARTKKGWVFHSLRDGFVGMCLGVREENGLPNIVSNPEFLKGD
jgi:hypothetical protein